MRAQTSLEFLYTASLMLLVFGIVMIIFYESQSDAANLAAYTESQRICHAVAAQVDAMDSAGDGASSVFSRPYSLSGQNYSVYVSGPNKSVSIIYAGQGTDCLFSTSSITNGSSATFYIAQSALIRNVNGGVVVG
jgi:uncharacterized protein (UPF0333 family)